MNAGKLERRNVDTDSPPVSRRVASRLLPFMLLLYLVAYLDRVNVGYAALQMNKELGFDEEVFGFGSGIFFLGYFLLEVPSNLILYRVGARRWISRIMVSWGLLSVSMMWVPNAHTFYILRFLLGAAEAGFFPGMVLYLTHWFVPSERGRAVSLFMTASALAGLVGGPLSGVFLSMHARGGLSGWQWLFLLEGLPAVLLGILVYFVLPDGPAQATWLSDQDKEQLAARLADAQQVEEAPGRMLEPRVWGFGALYFCIICSFYSVTLWLPQILQSFSGQSAVLVSFLSALPYLVAALGMVAVGAYSDRTGARRGPIMAGALTGAAGLVGTALVPHPGVGLLMLSLAALGIWGSLGPFWTVPTSYLRGRAAAGGIALINSLGNLGGFVGPFMVGALKKYTGHFEAGLLVLATGLVLAAGLARWLVPRGREKAIHS